MDKNKALTELQDIFDEVANNLDSELETLMDIDEQKERYAELDRQRKRFREIITELSK